VGNYFLWPSGVIDDPGYLRGFHGSKSESVTAKHKICRPLHLSVLPRLAA
jgi:hypothetical protein